MKLGWRYGIFSHGYLVAYVRIRWRRNASDFRLMRDFMEMHDEERYA